MSYRVENGDTISKVTDLLKVSWAELRRANPNAVGRSSKTGNWFLKQGAIIEGKNAFESVLQESRRSTAKPVAAKPVADKPVAAKARGEKGDCGRFAGLERLYGQKRRYAVGPGNQEIPRQGK